MPARLYGKDRTDPAKVEAAAMIDARLRSIMVLYAECETLGIEHGLSFGYSGPSGYGDGGNFNPDDIGEEDYRTGDESDGWTASSQNC